VAGTFFSGGAAFVVDPESGDVTAAEQFLHLADIDAGVEQQGGGGGRAASGC